MLAAVSLMWTFDQELHYLLHFLYHRYINAFIGTEQKILLFIYTDTVKEHNNTFTYKSVCFHFKFKGNVTRFKFYFFLELSSKE